MWSNYVEQFWGVILKSNFEEKLCGANVRSIYEEQIWGAARGADQILLFCTLQSGVSRKVKLIYLKPTSIY